MVDNIGTAASMSGAVIIFVLDVCLHLTISHA